MDLSLAPIRVMEPAIIERLRLAFPEETFGIERVPAVLTLNEFERVVRLSPFIGLSWVGLEPDRANARELAGRWQWALTLVYKSSGSDKRRFSGDALDIGQDAMVDVALALLQGAEIPRIGFCNVTGAKSAYADGWQDTNTVVARIDFEISTKSIPAAFKLKTAADFSRLGIAWLTGEPADPPAQPSVSDDLRIPT